MQEGAFGLLLLSIILLYCKSVYIYKVTVNKKKKKTLTRITVGSVAFLQLFRLCHWFLECYQTPVDSTYAVIQYVSFSSTKEWVHLHKIQIVKDMNTLNIGISTNFQSDKIGAHRQFIACYRNMINSIQKSENTKWIPIKLNGVT